MTLSSDAYLRLLPCKGVQGAAMGCTEYGPSSECHLVTLSWPGMTGYGTA